MQDIKVFYKYVDRRYSKQMEYFFEDRSDIYSMVNEVFTDCIHRDPNCCNQFIINKINWRFLDLYGKKKAEKEMFTPLLSSSTGDFEDAYVRGHSSGIAVWPDFSSLQTAEIMHAISQLPDCDSSLVKRFHFGNETLREIAKSEGIAHCTVLNRLRRIYKKLEKLI